MSILPEWHPAAWLSLASDKLCAVMLPQDCFLCGAPAGKELLCNPCKYALPQLPELRCPICALPTTGGETCGACLRQPPYFDATYARFRYAFPMDRLVQALKYQHRLAVSGFFAAALLEAPRPEGDLLMALSLSDRRLRERGFNQALEIARPLARKLDIPLLTHGCSRVLDTAPQTSLPWKERQKNVRNAFECSIDLSGKSVIVIDDVMTTGATLNEFARTLKKHGAAKVANWVVARALKH